MSTLQFVERQVSISGKNMDLTPALERHVRNKVKKIERIFADHPAVTIDAVLHAGKAGQTAEITVYVGGYVLRGESTSGDMYYSVNEAVSRIEGQVRKMKSRTAKRVHESASPWRNGSIDALTAADEADWDADESEWLRSTPVSIAKRKRFVVKPMDPSEAAMQMELLGHDFFVFTDDETFEVRVLYKRKDGTYGLIEPVIG